MLYKMIEWPRHAVTCRSLAETLVAEVKATAFYSPAGCQGLDTHRDDAHVFVAQLARPRAGRYSMARQVRGFDDRRAAAADCGAETH